jgi:hypothetical protein
MVATTSATGSISNARPSDMLSRSAVGASLMTPVRKGPADPTMAPKNKKIADAVARCSARANR